MKLSFWGRLAALIVSAALVLIVSCASPVPAGSTSSGGSGAAVAVTGVGLNKSSTSLVVGGTEQLTATLTPTGATNKKVTWSSSASSVASVSASGLVTGVASGTATITATTADGGKTATCAVAVSATAVAVTGVSLKASTTLAVGGTEQLTATITPAGATNQNVTWSTSASSIASVSASGLVTGVAHGTATITATTVDGGKTANCTVTVSAPADTSKLGFEAGFDPTTVSAYEGSVANGLTTGPKMGMVFSLDTALAKAGASSLKCTGTSQKNAYGTDYFGEATIPLSPTDFTSKPISVAVYVPAGSKICAAKLILMDATYNESQFPEQYSIVPGSWTTLTFDMTKTTWVYQTLDTSVTPNVPITTSVSAATSLRFRFLTQDATGTPVSAPVDVNLDSVNW